MVRHLVVVATIIALGAASVRAQRLPEVKDVQDVLSAAQASGRRVGVELRNTSMLYGTVVDVKGNRFILDEQKLGRRTIRYEDIRALLDPTTGNEIATVRFTRDAFANASVPARILIAAGVVVGVLVSIAVLGGGIGR